MLSDWSTRIQPHTQQASTYINILSKDQSTGHSTVQVTSSCGNKILPDISDIDLLPEVL